MKKILLIFAAFLQAVTSFAQLKSEPTYQKTLEVATAKNLPILVYIMPMHFPSVSPNGKPVVNGMDKPEVVDFYSKNFVFFKAKYGDSSAIPFVQKYKLTRFPALIFTDSKGYLLSKDFIGMSFPEPYLNSGKAALNKLKAGNTLGDYEAKYRGGQVDPIFLKEFIKHKQSLGINDNSALIEQYVNSLKISDLNSYAEVLFILKSGPFINGKAYTLIHTNRQLVDSIYKTEPLADRIAMNTVMRENTMNEAIRTKSNLMMNNLSGFVYNVYKATPKEASKQSLYTRIYYAKAIKDTAQFIAYATSYYDMYYMGIGADSIKRMEKRAAEQRTKIMTENAKKSIAEIKKFMPAGRVKDSISIRPAALSGEPVSVVAYTLNNAAWDVYSLGIKNPNMLIKAMIWSRRAIELSSTASFYDTMAHIMYRLKFRDEALFNQEKAVALATTEKKTQTEIDNLKKDALLMKQGKL